MAQRNQQVMSDQRKKIVLQNFLNGRLGHSTNHVGLGGKHYCIKNSGLWLSEINKLCLIKRKHYFIINFRIIIQRNQQAMFDKRKK